MRRNAGGTGTLVQPLADIIATAPLAASGGTPFVETNGISIIMDGSGLMAAYKVNHNLLKNFGIAMSDSVGTRTFSVQNAEWLANDELKLTLGGSDNFISDFISTATGTVSAALRPNFFRVSSQGVLDDYAPNTGIRIRFDATMYDTDGKPDESASYSAAHNAQPTADIDLLNSRNWDVFRFKVEFDLSTDGSPVNPLSPRPSLESLRLPFTY